MNEEGVGNNKGDISNNALDADVVGFFELLIKIDQRINPKSYENNRSLYQAN